MPAGGDTAAAANIDHAEIVMTTKADVDAYLSTVPVKRRDVLAALRAACVEELSGFTETLAYGMPSYERHGEVEVAFADQKRYISLYILRAEVLDRHRDRLIHLDVGKGCIRYRKAADIDMDVVRSMLRATAATEGNVC